MSMNYPRTFDARIKDAVLKHLPCGYDWLLYKAQIAKESSMRPGAVSPAGAMGLAQIMPGTWAQWGEGDPLNPADSLNAGAKYMAYLYGQWTAPRPEADRLNLAMASYNAGLGNLLKAQKLAGGANGYSAIITKLPDVTGEHSRETIEYVARIQIIRGYFASLP